MHIRYKAGHTSLHLSHHNAENKANISITNVAINIHGIRHVCFYYWTLGIKIVVNHCKNVGQHYAFNSLSLFKRSHLVQMWLACNSQGNCYSHCNTVIMEYWIFCNNWQEKSNTLVKTKIIPLWIFKFIYDFHYVTTSCTEIECSFVTFQGHV